MKNWNPISKLDEKVKKLCQYRKKQKFKNPEPRMGTVAYEVCSKKDRTFAIKTLLLILQHFKHCPPQSSPLYWQYTVPNVSPIFGMPPGTHFK